MKNFIEYLEESIESKKRPGSDWYSPTKQVKVKSLGSLAMRFIPSEEDQSKYPSFNMNNFRNAFKKVIDRHVASSGLSRDEVIDHIIDPDSAVGKELRDKVTIPGFPQNIKIKFANEAK